MNFIAGTASNNSWSTSGITVAGFAGNASAAANHLNFSYAIALDSNESLYIADFYNHRIQKYPKGSMSSVTVAGNRFGFLGSNLSSFNGPTSIAFDSNDNMYVVDRNNHRVMFWLKNAVQGTVVAGTSGMSVNLSLNLVEITV